MLYLSSTAGQFTLVETHSSKTYNSIGVSEHLVRRNSTVCCQDLARAVADRELRLEPLVLGVFLLIFVHGSALLFSAQLYLWHLLNPRSILSQRRLVDNKKELRAVIHRYPQKEQ